MRIQKGLVQVLLHEKGGLHHVLGFNPSHLEIASARPGRRHGHRVGFAFSRDAWCPGASSWPIPGSNGPCFQSHIVVVKIEVQRKVGIGSLQVHVEQAVDGGLYLGGIILTNLGVHSNKELSSKSDGWPW